MKKYMTMVLAAALVFAFVGQASAALETNGEYRGRFWYLSNYTPISTDDTGDEFWDQRLRLGMTWKVSDTVKVAARADILENVWDTSKDAQEIDFDWAYAQFAWGATNLSVGKQDVTWGPGVYAKADNRYRARIGGKFDKIGWGFAWDKLAENRGDYDNDDNGFSLGVSMPMEQWTLGVLGVYRDWGKAADKTIMGIDVYFNGTAGNVKLVGEGAYATGDSGKNDQEGLMAYLGAFLPLGPVNCGFEFGYAQGDDPKTADNEGALFHDYNGPYNSFILFNNFDLDGWNSVYSGGADRGLNNAMSAKVSATMPLSKQFSLYGAAVWAQASEKGARSSDDMGIEFDGLAKYALTENVTVQAGVGYLAAGDYFGKGVDDPFVATAHAIVTF